MLVAIILHALITRIQSPAPAQPAPPPAAPAPATAPAPAANFPITSFRDSLKNAIESLRNAEVLS
jgi:hypothetical protein